MRVLHYFLGFPPYRTGGLTKYVYDLMKGQVEEKHHVMALWPGKMGFASGQIKIKKRTSIDDIENYELINPLPVSLDEGITEFNEFMKSCDPSIYENFFKEIKPDAIHIHTLMGLHKEFVETANNLKIRIVFTTHDYFGICPKVTLYRFGDVCENDHGCKDCIQCNYRALSLLKIRILQSPLYRSIKNLAFIKRVRVQHRDDFFTNEVITRKPIGETKATILAEKYRELREYYIGILTKIDLIHFNSSITEAIYRRYLTPKNSLVMTITHQNIADNRMINNWKIGKILRITSLAPAKPFKGFNVLKSALDELWVEEQLIFELKLFSPVQNSSPYMKIQKEGFMHDQLGSILEDTDILVAISICYETFGFTVLEAISYGVPVIVSDHVGAKDVIGDGGIVVEAGNKESLKRAILSLDQDKQLELRNNNKEKVEIKNWKVFLYETNRLYKDIQ